MRTTLVASPRDTSFELPLGGKFYFMSWRESWPNFSWVSEFCFWTSLKWALFLHLIILSFGVSSLPTPSLRSFLLKNKNFFLTLAVILQRKSAYGADIRLDSCINNHFSLFFHFHQLSLSITVTSYIFLAVKTFCSSYYSTSSIVTVPLAGQLKWANGVIIDC